MTTGKSVTLWIAAFVFMAAIAIYQRMTGPTYPIGGEVKVSGKTIDYSFPRSHAGSGEQLIKVEAPENFEGKMKLRRYKSYDKWQTVDMKRVGDVLTADIPEQPPAGKVMYQVFIGPDESSMERLTKEPVIIRFKGAVPDFILIPHIIFMFTAMVFSTRTILEVIFKGKNVYMMSLITTICFGIGGLFLGPVVQNYAFGAFWTGWPFGEDLTDNKTLFAFLGWLWATLRIKTKPEAKGWAIFAGLLLLAVYLIPHSVLGSEINYKELEKQQVN